MVLRRGSSGPEVAALQRKLTVAHFDPGRNDGVFGGATEAALMAFQRSSGLLADGVAGSRTLTALGLDADRRAEAVGMTVEIASSMLPAAPFGNIETHLPIVLDALATAGIADKPMVLMALATIRAETAGFVPVSEAMSWFNTSPGGHPFDLYDHRQDLGNFGAPDGEPFRGRGFVQLTGRQNYLRHGAGIGIGERLVADPEEANEAGTAAALLASFLKARERDIKEALLERDFRHARRLVNGGAHGVQEFAEAFQTGQRLLA